MFKALWYKVLDNYFFAGFVCFVIGFFAVVVHIATFSIRWLKR